LAGLGLEKPPRAELLELINGAEFRRLVPSQVLTKLHAIRQHGNTAAHGGEMQTRTALWLLQEAFDVARWLFVSQFNGSLASIGTYQPVPAGGAEAETKGQVKGEKREALAQLAAQEARYQEILRELEATRDARQVAEDEAARLREELRQKGASAIGQLHFDEATTRQRLIDTMLAEAGWDVGANGRSTDEVTQEFEVEHQPTETGRGKIDYVLWDADGKPLAIIEAKRTSIDAGQGHTQARIYADALELIYRRRPVIFCTNGVEIWIWDDAQGWPPRQLFGFYSKDSLQRLIFQRTQGKPLDALSPLPAIIDRDYQIEAVKRVTERFGAKRRKALDVQATGTGKTRVAIALTDLMMRANHVKRVLFLCDRRELRKQARDAFTECTSHTPAIIRASTAKERNDRVYLATYPAMMQIYRSFDPGFFDLIIADESHRSIYNVYGDLFRWFDGYELGLTATPVELISRSTCELFDCTRNDPTFHYSYEEAVEERCVVPFELYTHTTKFLRQGIKGGELTDDQIAELEDQGIDPNTLDFEAVEIDRQIFNRDTNRKILQNLMDEGLRKADGQTLGKSIIFARNHRHAVLLRELFDELYPQYGAKFCQVIDNYEPRSDALIDEFKDLNNELTIAISVDMLDTGIDVPEVVNLVFAKPVKSKIKFWQMIGRGTRLCENLFGSGRDKLRFRIFDHWGNFEYHHTSGMQAEPRDGKGPMQLVFEARINLAEAALRAADLDTFNMAVGSLKGDINRLPEESIRVRERWREVREAKNSPRIHHFDPATVALLRNDIAPLMQWVDIRGDTRALELDRLVAEMQCDLLMGSSAFADRKGELTTRIQSLPMHVNQVRQKAELIAAIRKPDWWHPDQLTPAKLEDARSDLRSLMRHLPSGGDDSRPPRIIDVTDTDIELRLERSRIPSVDLAAYRQRVREALETLFVTDPTLAKIRRGESVAGTDLDRLTSLVLTQHPDLDLTVLKDFYVVAEPFDRIIRSIVGLDAGAVAARFSQFVQTYPQLTAKQQSFLRLLKNHIARHGAIEIDDLYRAPFDKIDRGGPDGIFSDDAQITALLDIIQTFEKPLREKTAY
jgi:type I restriction enzyme R subunit